MWLRIVWNRFHTKRLMNIISMRSYLCKQHFQLSGTASSCTTAWSTGRAKYATRPVQFDSRANDSSGSVLFSESLTYNATSPNLEQITLVSRFFLVNWISRVPFKNEWMTDWFDSLTDSYESSLTKSQHKLLLSNRDWLLTVICCSLWILSLKSVW